MAMVAFVAGFCCPLAKYNGAVLVPVLISLGFAGRPGGEVANAKNGGNSPSRWDRIRAGFPPGLVAILTAPILSLICWAGYSWVKYGAVHFLKMSAFQRGQTHSLDPATLTVGILGCSWPWRRATGLCSAFSSDPRFGVACCDSRVQRDWSCIAGCPCALRFPSVLMLAFSVFVSVYVLGLVVRLALRGAAERPGVDATCRLGSGWVGVSVWADVHCREICSVSSASHHRSGSEALFMGSSPRPASWSLGREPPLCVCSRLR